MSIKSFACEETKALFHRRRTRKFGNIERVAFRRLQELNAAQSLRDLRGSGNSLEKLEDDLAGYHSIRINRQWRVVFKWEGGDAHQVRITDYH